ncbi:MAG: hypothetical protein DI534_03620 [Leifsonia xyli]|nr:MAG: hypothetical protein DI534_03620 [Leifsonia xyli]
MLANASRPATDIAPLVSEGVFVPGGEARAPVSDAPLDDSVVRAKKDAPLTPLGVEELSRAQLTGREEYADLYVNSAGQKFAALSLTPKNVRDNKGTWVPLSEAITESADGSAAAKLHPLSPVFGKDASSKMLTVTRNGFTVSMSLEGVRKAARSSVVGAGTNKVSYADALPGVDVTFEIDGATVTEKQPSPCDPG